MSFDDLGCWLFRIIDHRFSFFGFWVATAQDSLHRDVEPGSEPGDVVRVGFTGAVFDARESRGGDGCFPSNIAEAEPALFALPLDGASELFGVYEAFSWTIPGFHGA